MAEEEIPVLGPVTVTFDPASAAEVAMVLQHVLHNVPDNPRPDQAARAHNLGLAAMVVSGGLIKAMHDAGLSDEIIARASGQLYQAPHEDAAQLELAADLADDPQNPHNEVPHLERAPGWEADAVEDPTPDPNVVDFPTPGGPVDAA